MLQICYSGAPYLVPEEFKKAKFDFLEEAMIFMRLSFIFVVLFFAFSIYEINKFNKTNRVQLRNTASIFSAFLFLVSLPLFYYNIKY